MTSKERVKAAIELKEADRMPVQAGCAPELTFALMKKFNQYDYPKLCVELGNDLLLTRTGKSIFDIGPFDFPEGEDEMVGPWGCRWKKEITEKGANCAIIDGPLYNDDEDGRLLKEYQIPVPEDSDFDDLRKLVAEYGKTHWITAFIGDGIFQPAWALHGMENMMVDMLANPDYANEIFDKVMKFSIDAGEKMIDCGADMVMVSDDMGSQENMLISPDMWRTFMKPRMADMISTFKKRNPKIVFAYHSCGYIIPIIDELIEIGVDVIQPIQPLSMDPAVLKEKFGSRVCLWGGIDTQKTLPMGTKEQIREEIKLRRETVGNGGGYICAPSHVVQSDTSIENIMEFYEAARTLGKY